MCRTLILVDGMASLYRSFHAIRGLETRSGEPTNAVFGFIRMMRQVRKVWHPTHWVVGFDGGLPARRMSLLPEYKAQRPEMPAGLRRQIPRVEEYLDRAGIVWVRKDKEEADDVLATLALKGAQQGANVLIVTNDKDLYQIVGESIRLVPAAGDMKAMGPVDVKAKTGVEPGQIVDWLSLVGDSADNIPGVPGIGKKTAAALLQEHQSVTALLSSTDRVSNARIRAALEAHRETVARNQEMVRLRSDVECDVDWAAAAVREEDASRMIPFLEALELNSLAREMRQPELFPT